MSCPRTDEILLLDDPGLEPARRLLLEAHLGACAECAALEEALYRAEEWLAAADPAPLGVLARLVLPRRPSLPVGAALVAAAAVAFLAVMWPRPEEAPVAPPAPPSIRVAAEVPVPEPRAFPPLRELVLALDPGSDGFAEAADGVAESVRREGSRGLDALVRMLDPAEPETARRALAVAARAPSPALLRALIPLLDDAALAPHAARVVANAGGAAAVPALERALAGPAAVEAREALVAIGGRAATDALLRQADDPAVLDALARLSPADAAPFCVARDDAELLARRPALLPELRALARRGDARAAVLLGRAGDRETLPLLRELATTRVRDAVRGMVALGSDDALREAFRLARRSDAAGDGFGGARGAENFLLARLSGGTHAERALAIDLLRRCGGPASVGPLLAAAAERAMAPAVVRALGAIGGDAAATALLSLRGERGVRRELIEALADTRSDLAVPGLLEMARAEDRAVAALARIGSKASAAALVDLLADRRAGRDAERALAAFAPEVAVPVLLARFEEAPRARRALAEIAGTDLGGNVGRWRDWWTTKP